MDLLAVAQFLGGVVALVGGAWLLITGGTRVAAVLGVPSVVIGLTVVAAGTSLPEAAASVAAVLKGQRDIAVPESGVHNPAGQTDIGTHALMPFSLLATWYHEMAHGLMAMLLGANFDQLVIYSNGSGFAQYSTDSQMWGISSALIAAAGLIVILLAGLSVRLILLSALLAMAAAPLLWFNMHDYQRRRVLTFLNPESDPLGSGYHIIQSKIAIGSGGLYGKGWLNGTQSQLDFLPERHTDFIFAVLSEEFGLIGVLILLALYLFIIARGLYIATRAQGTFNRLLAGSLILVFFVYLFVNTGMVSGLLPVVGVPLPLVSYGGTSLVTLMAGFGMLMSIQSHRRLLVH